MKKTARIFLLLGCLSSALSACALFEPEPPYFVIAPFSAEEAQKALAPGKNTVTGMAYITAQSGSMGTCAGGQVKLIPKTAHSSERIRVEFGNENYGHLGKYDSHPDFSMNNPEYDQVGYRTVSCSPDGTFTFDRVANGDYFLTTDIAWTEKEMTVVDVPPPYVYRPKGMTDKDYERIRRDATRNSPSQKLVEKKKSHAGSLMQKISVKNQGVVNVQMAGRE